MLRWKRRSEKFGPLFGGSVVYWFISTWDNAHKPRKPSKPETDKPSYFPPCLAATTSSATFFGTLA